jgi:Helix-turn-helix domain
VLDANLFGRRLTMARAHAGLTQEGLAQAVRDLGFDLTARLVGIYEGSPREGARIPPAHILLALVRVLNPPGGKEWFADCFPEEIRGVWLDGSRHPSRLLELVQEEEPSDAE